MKGLSLLLGLVFLAMVARAGIHWVTHNYNASFEGNALQGALQVARGKALYPGSDQLPVQLYLYSPLHAWVSGTLVRALPFPLSLHTQVILIRFVSLCALLGALFFLIQTLLPNVSSWALWLSLGLLLSHFADYVTTARNDMLALLFELGLVTFFAQWLRSPKPRYLVWTILCAWAAVATRQTAVLGFGLSFLVLLWKREWKIAGAVALAYTALVGLTLAGLYLTSGPAVLEHLWLANTNRGWRAPSELWQRSYQAFLGSYLMYFLLCLLGVREYRKKAGAEITLYLAAFTLLTLAVFSVVLFRMGGGTNYLFVPLLSALPFCVSALTKERLQSFWFRGGLALQFGIIIFVLSAKTWSAYQTEQKPFTEIARTIQEQSTGFTYIWGAYAPNLKIHLGDTSLHGPDVEQIADYPGPAYNWIYPQLRQLVKENRIDLVVMADPNCPKEGRPFLARIEYPIDGPRKLHAIFEKYRFDSSSHSWICYYRPQNEKPALLSKATHMP